MARTRRKPPSPALSAEFRKNRIRRKFLMQKADEEDRKARNAKTAEAAIKHAERAIDLRAEAKSLRVRRRPLKGSNPRRRNGGGNGQGGLFG